jgi:hypothetical protein
MPVHVDTARPQALNGKTLGSLWIVYGVLRLSMVVCLILYSRIATLMFGALLTNVPNPFFWMDLFHFAYVFAIVLTALAGIFSLLAGFALVASTSSARRLALTAAFLSVSEVPFGITLGTYTFVLFFRSTDK